MSAVLDHLKPYLPEMEEFLRALVECESPTDNKEAVDRFANLMAERLQTIGAKVETIPQDSAGNHIRAEWDLRGPEDRPPRRADGQILVLCHMDTVWPVGEIARRPFRVEKGKVFGPGAWDMKGGTTLGYYAVKAIRELGLGTKLRVVFLLNSDEETQSRHSRGLIEAEAKKSDYVLCLEPSYPACTLTTFRKSVGTYTMEITGKASHAGAAPEEGISAIHELANQIIYLHGLTDYDKGTTVNVGVVSGGSRPNIMAPDARALIDVRLSTPEETERITKAMSALKPTIAGTSIKVTGGLERPLMARTPQIVALFERAQAIAKQLGFEVSQTGSGGVSDANFPGALGIPTLDGLGPTGGGAHALSEFANLDSFVPRAALIAELLQVLD